MATRAWAYHAFIMGLFLGQPTLSRGEPSEVEGLKTPDSPVLSLLGTSSPSIQRPATPKAVAVLLANSLAHSDGRLPEDFGLEVAPYWLTPRKDLTFSDYYQAGFIQTVEQSFAVSLVTSSPLPDSVLSIMPGGVLAGAGIRFALLRGRPANLSQDKDSLAKVLKLIQEEVQKPGGPDSAAIHQYTQTAGEIAERLGTPRREGWNSDLGMAVTYRIPGGGVDSSELYKIGIWPSLSYVTPNLEAIAMARYLYDALVDSSHALDAGLRLVGKYRGAALSLEAMLRMAGGGKWNLGDASRLVGLFEYQVAKGSYLSIGLGQDFKGADPRRLIAMAGLSIGFGADPILVGK